MPNLSDLQKKTSIVSTSSFIAGYDASDTSQSSGGSTVTWPASAFQTLAWAISSNYGIQNISPVYMAVNSNSASWNYQGTDVKSLTSNWQNTFSTVNSTSASWGGSTISLPSSANWNETYTSFSAQSANNLRVYTTVNSNSANWNYQGTDIKSLTANWQNTFTTVSSSSASWGGGSSISTPSVYYVTSNGNDTTGNGSINFPYLTIDKAYTVGVASANKFVINIGSGDFDWNENSEISNLLIRIIGSGVNYSSGEYVTKITINNTPDIINGSDGATGFSPQLHIDDCLLSITCNGGDGAFECNGGPAGSLRLTGSAMIDDITHRGGDAGGGGGYNGGSGGALVVKNMIFGASISNIDVNGGNPSDGGSPGASGSIEFDGCDVRGVEFIGIGSSTFGRTSYTAGFVITSDKGGNAEY